MVRHGDRVVADIDVDGVESVDAGDPHDRQGDLARGRARGEHRLPDADAEIEDPDREGVVDHRQHLGVRRRALGGADERLQRREELASSHVLQPK